jgi:hypothetical protein
MSTNPTSFRYPTPNLDGKGDPELVEQIQFHDNAIQDLQQAIPSLKSQIEALKTSTTAAASTTTNITTEAENTVIVSSTIGMVNDQAGNTAYSTQQSDYGAFIQLDDASAIAVTLTTGPSIQVPFFFWAQNFGAGTATLTPQTGTIDGGSSFALLENQAVAVIYDGTNFTTVLIPVGPQNTPAVAGEFLTAYNSSTGTFSQAGTTGLSVTITTAALTSLGTQGSMTFTAGRLTSQTPAT